MKNHLVFDLESDGLLHEATTCWILVTEDLGTGEVNCYSDYDKALPPLGEGLKQLAAAERLIGHNVLMFDFPLLEKLYGFKYPVEKITDTLILSQCLNYKRFGFGHSLERWGNSVGQPKVEHEDWSQYSPEMKVRCVTDVKLNKLVYESLIKELNGRKNKSVLSRVLKAEHYVSEFVGQSIRSGWNFNKERAEELLKLLEGEMKEITDRVEPMLFKKVIQVDREPEFKEPKWIQNGNYSMNTVRWFGLEPETGQESDRPIFGPYCRIDIVEPDIGSIDSVKVLLYSRGWKPTEWNTKRDSKGKVVQTTPKFTEDSLKPLGQLGEDIDTFYTLRSRHSIVKGWLEQLNPSTSRLHGDCFVIGTPTFRSAHKIIANIPSAEVQPKLFENGVWRDPTKEENKSKRWSTGAKFLSDSWKARYKLPVEAKEGDQVLLAVSAFGPQIRSLFESEAGWSMIGADSSGNQMRGLCFYIGDDNFTNEVIGGDVHTLNMNLINTVLKKTKFRVTRGDCKRILYALLFGAGDGKVGLYVTGKTDTKIGKLIRKALYEGIPGLGKLIAKLEAMYEKTSDRGKPYIIGITGRPIYVPGKHTLLVYLLQELEKATVSLSVAWLVRKLRENNIPYKPLIVYHDEVEFLVPEEHATFAAELASQAFHEGPKELGVNIMAGESKVGFNWGDVH